MQDRLGGQGRRGQAPRVPHVGRAARRQGRLDQVHQVSGGYSYISLAKHAGACCSETLMLFYVRSVDTLVLFCAERASARTRSTTCWRRGARKRSRASRIATTRNSGACAPSGHLLVDDTACLVSEHLLTQGSLNHRARLHHTRTLSDNCGTDVIRASV